VLRARRWDWLGGIRRTWHKWAASLKRKWKQVDCFHEENIEESGWPCGVVVESATAAGGGVNRRRSFMGWLFPLRLVEGR
jgi:hypothetical protein